MLVVNCAFNIIVNAHLPSHHLHVNEYNVCYMLLILNHYGLLSPFLLPQATSSILLNAIFYPSDLI